MTIEITCSGCSRKLRLADRAAGSRGKCPHCGAVLQIPATPAGVSAATAAPTAAKAAAAPGGGGNSGGKLSFSCPACSKVVHAPAAMAGKRGKCPHCQTVVVIGGAPAAATGGWSEPAPLSSGDLTPLAPLGNNASDLFADLPPLAPLPALDAKVLPDGPPLNPLGVPAAAWIAPQSAPLSAGSPFMATNPYAASAAARGTSRTAPAKLLVPAILLFVTSLMSIGYSIYQGINVLQHPELGRRFAARIDNPQEAQAAENGYVLGTIVFGTAIVIVNGGVLFGAIQMVRLRGFDMARAGATLALIPCCSILCLNIPLGIWALIVLFQPDVRRQFA